MNLLVISQYFYPEQFRVSDVCFRLVEMGHEVTVLTGLPNYPVGEIFAGYDWVSLNMGNIDCHNDDLHGSPVVIEYIKGVRVLRCKLSPRKTGKMDLAKNYLSFAYNSSMVALSIAKAVKMDFKKNNGDNYKSNTYSFDKVLVFQYSPITMAIPGIILKNKLKIPLILYCFDLWPESIVSAGLPNHGLIYSLILKLSKWIYKKADTLIISSKNFEKYFNNKLGIFNNIHYLPIYAEDIFSSNSSYNGKVENETINSSILDEINLVFAGNIGEMQSIDTIIKSCKEILEMQKNNYDLQKITFHIIGDGSALEKNIHLAKELGISNINFHGRHPLEDMPLFYNLADAFLVTLRNDEFISYTLPGKIQSYMASGKPIIGAINGETAFVINQSGCGLCCDAEDYKSLAKIILQFASEKENRQKFGDCSRSYYEANFSADSFFTNLISYLQIRS